MTHVVIIEDNLHDRQFLEEGFAQSAPNAKLHILSDGEKALELSANAHKVKPLYPTGFKKLVHSIVDFWLDPGDR